MQILISCTLGFILDLLFGDPSYILHPVVIIGKLIEKFEGFIRSKLPSSNKAELLGGGVVAVLIPLITGVFTFSICYFTYKIHPLISLVFQTLWCWQALAIKGLADESKKVYNELIKNDLPSARKVVSRIVGRDTDSLDYDGVT